MPARDDTLDLFGDQADAIEVAQPFKQIAQPPKRATSVDPAQDLYQLPAKPLPVGEQSNSDAFAFTEEAKAAFDPDAEAEQEARRRQATRRLTRKAGRAKSSIANKTQASGSARDAPLQRGRPDAAEVHYLSVLEVAARFGSGKATIWRWSRENPEFPKPIHLGPGVTRWPFDEIVAYETMLKERR